MKFEYISSILSEEEWLIHQEGYDNQLNQRYETLFTLSNGYKGTRGSLEEGSKFDHPGNYVAGIFDQSEANAKELVNTQHWHGIRLLAEGELLHPDHCKVLEFRRVLDMKKGLLARRTVLKDSKGRETLIEGLRYLSRSNVHRAAIVYCITPLNYSGTLIIASGVNGQVFNTQTIPKLDIRHLDIIQSTGLHEKGCYLETATRDADIRIGIGSAIIVNEGIERKGIDAGEDCISETIELNIDEGKMIEVSKHVCTYTSRDSEKSKLKEIVEKDLKTFTHEGFYPEMERHAEAYAKLWKTSDIRIDGDAAANKALRFNIFHLMSVANEHDPKISLGAKGLHGEGYKGHVFWDTEIFMLPFFIYSHPRAAKALLTYRYHGLEGAREKAARNGFKGAQYPWESADTAEEECPDWAIDFSGEVIKVLTGEMEHHITADVAYAFYQYFRATDDQDFMKAYGLEVMIETARFWVSRCDYSKDKNCYEIKDVIGPDEFHEGVDNNAYTNYMARWNIQKAIELVKCFKERYRSDYNRIAEKTKLADEEIESWSQIEARIYTPFDKETKRIEQFDGYFNRKDYKIRAYDENDMPVWPEGADLFNLGKTQLVKQADVVLLTMLLREDLDEETIRINYEYYNQRTMHKSSLSPAVYAVAGLAAGDPSKAYPYFKRAVYTDLLDNQGNTSHGLHAAAAGGTWQSVVFGFAGMHVDKEGYLCFSPQLPEGWKELSFKTYWKGRILNISISKRHVNVRPEENSDQELIIKIHGKIAKFGQSL
ncbi:MAG: glycoside hydrolase family 65 protein [Clostridia bacterium]|nr:glycoside hydrolase family 65 protein [Clostridia bacterium]